MKNKSEIAHLRYYCHRNRGSLFETGLVNKMSFMDIPSDSFRKYVSRLVEEKELTQVSKGLYYIGSELPENIEGLVIMYFLDSPGSCYGGDSLLRYLGIIDYKPKNVTIYSGASNRKIGRIEIKKTPAGYLSCRYLELLELLSLQDKVPDYGFTEYLDAIFERLPRYEEDQRRFSSALDRLEPSYPRIVYIRLASYFEKFNIPIQVMDWYAHRMSLSHSK